MKSSPSTKKSTPSSKTVPNNLDLYAKVEDLLGVKEAAPHLYRYYFDFLATIKFDSLLDVGCGSGDFLSTINKRFAPTTLHGIDLSPHMVAQSRAKGLDTKVMNLCDVEGSYDVLTAVFDMVNYLDPKQLTLFMNCVEGHLREGGYFLCDLNTLVGFEEVAVGSVSIDDGERFLSVESDFDNGCYRADFTLFESQGELYAKSRATIHQSYHPTKRLQKALKSMTLITQTPIQLYIEKSDKLFLVFRKTLSC